MKQLGDRLRDLREARNLKQTDVANALKISNKILSSYERNISLPTLDNLKNICKYYNVSADQLLDIELDKTIVPAEETNSLVSITLSKKEFCHFTKGLIQKKKELFGDL